MIRARLQGFGSLSQRCIVRSCSGSDIFASERVKPALSTLIRSSQCNDDGPGQQPTHSNGNVQKTSLLCATPCQLLQGLNDRLDTGTHLAFTPGFYRVARLSEQE